MRISNMLLIAALAGGCGDDTATPTDHVTRPDAGATAGGGGSASEQDAPCTISIALIDYKLDPKAVEASPGEITLCAENKGQAPHDLAVRDASGETLGKTKTLSPNERDQFTVELEAANYDIYCTQAGHESLGMKGTLSVH
jgi:plastocyanin